MLSSFSNKVNRFLVVLAIAGHLLHILGGCCLHHSHTDIDSGNSDGQILCQVVNCQESRVYSADDHCSASFFSGSEISDPDSQISDVCSDDCFSSKINSEVAPLLKDVSFETEKMFAGQTCQRHTEHPPFDSHCDRIEQLNFLPLNVKSILTSVDFDGIILLAKADFLPVHLSFWFCSIFYHVFGQQNIAFFLVFCSLLF